MFKEWQELARETIKIITFAPELDNNFELLTELREMGVLPSMGHTNASYDSAVSAISHGVTHATHLFNGMKGLHHRDPGVVGAALLHDEVYSFSSRFVETNFEDERARTNCGHY
mgnify:CR=1 FL=1